MKEPTLKIIKIRQLFPHHHLDQPSERFLSLLKGEKFSTAIAGRKRIAIAVGSRGISDIAIFVNEMVRYLKSIGVKPFIIPAMGSHGFATAEGQKMVLSKLGLKENKIGTEIVSSMDVLTIGKVRMDDRQYPVYVDKTGWERADGIILINRIKPHTDFVSRYESGLVKMATVGLGNHEGAEQVHCLGVRGLKELMPAMAKVVFGKNKIIGGFAIIEDAYHKTAGLYWLNRDEIFDREPLLLRRAKALMPHLPAKEIDLLVIKQMGKDISGVGVDTKTIGRLMIWGQKELTLPKIELIGICDITDKSYGNAIGIGLADFVTEKLFKKINFDSLKENIFTATFYQRGKIPIVLCNERQIIEVSLRHFQKRGRENPRVVIIKDTLNLSTVYVSQAVLDEMRNKDGIKLLSRPQEIKFDNRDNIVAEL